MTIEQNRIVALLDIDQTLIFGPQGDVRYNYNLINTLLKNGVNDVYLFSKMSLTYYNIQERQILIQVLQKEGLMVHGTICASDLIWNKNKELLKDFSQEVWQTNNAAFLELFRQERFKSLTRFDDVARPGEAFAQVALRTDDWSNEDALMYQNAASDIMRYLNHHSISEHKNAIAEAEKSYLYEMFVKHKPEWSGAVIFVDDNIKEISAVRGMHKQISPEHKLLTLHNKNEKGATENTESFYQETIQPFVELPFALSHALNSYQFARKLTHSTAKKEILERLELALVNCKSSEEVAQVKVTFDKEYQRLNHHRFSFWSHAKTRSAMVFDTMIEKREKQTMNLL